MIFKKKSNRKIAYLKAVTVITVIACLALVGRRPRFSEAIWSYGSFSVYRNNSGALRVGDAAAGAGDHRVEQYLESFTVDRVKGTTPRWYPLGERVELEVTPPIGTVLQSNGVTAEEEAWIRSEIWKRLESNRLLKGLDHEVQSQFQTTGRGVAERPLVANTLYLVASGFAVVLAAACATLLVHALICTEVRSRRTRMGKCAKCGYPIAGHALCTECGEPIEVLGNDS